MLRLEISFKLSPLSPTSPYRNITMSVAYCRL